MLYDGVTIYSSHEKKYFTSIPINRDSIAFIILHTGTDDALYRMLNYLSRNNPKNNVYVIIPYGSEFDKSTIEKYPNINWVVFDKPKDRIYMVMFVGKETYENYVAVLDTSYDIVKFNENAIKQVFKNDSKAVCVSPFVYSNVDSLFPTCYAPKITDNIKVDIISLIPEENFVNTLYPFMLLGVYKKQTFLLGGEVDYKIEDLNIREYDYFARLWLMGYHTYMSSCFKVRSNMEFVPIIDRTYTKSHHILSSKLLSFFKNRGGNAGLRPFWWINYKIIYVIKDVRPFLKKATIDFYTLVRIWTVELGDVDDIL